MIIEESIDLQGLSLDAAIIKLLEIEERMPKHPDAFKPYLNFYNDAAEGRSCTVIYYEDDK